MKEVPNHERELRSDAWVSPPRVQKCEGGGGSGSRRGVQILGALDIREPRDLDVWTDVLTFELFAGTYGGVIQKRDGSKVLSTFAPYGRIEIWTGPWRAGDEDFSGMRETVTHGGFLHWAPRKVIRWKEAMGRPKDEVDVKLIRRAMRR